MNGSVSLTAVIADDEDGARRHLRALLEACAVRTLAECASGRQVLEAAHRLRPDVVCLDVRMPELDGLEAARRLPPGPAVVFTTGYPDYAVSAFEVDAADFLVKPLAAARLEAAVRRVRMRLGRPLRPAPAPPVPRIFVPSADHSLALAPRAIRYVEAASGGCLIHADGGSFPVRTSMDRLEHLLAPSGFLRTHRAYLVNLRRIRALVPWSRHVHSALLDGREETHVPVAKSRLAALRRSVIWIPRTGGQTGGPGTTREGGDRRRREPGPGPGDRGGPGD